MFSVEALRWEQKLALAVLPEATPGYNWPSLGNKVELDADKIN